MPRFWSLIVALVALAVYLTECPAVTGDKDSPEFTLVLALAGVSHPTGYPLYTLLGHVFVRLLHGLGATWAYAANAWSALGGAVAIYFLHRLAARLVPAESRLGRRGRLLLGLLPVGLFAFNPIWTYETTLAEVNSWHVAWAMGAALFFTRLTQAIARDGERPASWLYRNAAAWGFVCGLGGAHHATSLFVSAPLSIALLLALALRRRLRVGLIPVVIIAACVPLLSYGFILWRASHPAPMQWWGLTPGLEGLLWHATGGAYAKALGGYAPGPQQRQLLLWYVYPFLFPGLLILLASAARARGFGGRTVLWGLAAAALLGTAYTFEYGVTDPSSYFLYPMAFGLAALAPLLGQLLAGGARLRRAARAIASLLGLASVVLWAPWLRTGQQRVGMFVSFDQLVRRMWTAIPADTGFVFWTDDLHTKLLGYQLLDHQKPGLTVEYGFLLYRPEIRARFAQRYGFDPAEGLPPLTGLGGPGANASLERAVDAVEARVSAMSPLPVFHFDPGVPTVRLILKAGMRGDTTRAGSATPGRPPSRPGSP